MNRPGVSGPEPWAARLRAARGVLFDFDGTLAPNLDLPGLRRQVVEFTLDHGVPEPVFAGRYIVEVLDAAAAWLAAHDAAAAADFHRRGHTLIRDFEVDAAHNTGPFDDAVTLLERLRARGQRIAVVTRNCRDAVLTVFPDVERHCDRVLTRDDVDHLKPDVRHLQGALDGIEVPAAQAVMVGDGQMDMEIGHSLGMYCVGVLTGSSDRQRLAGAGADVVLPRAGALLEALETV